MKILIDTDDEKAMLALANAIADKLLPLLAAEAKPAPAKPASKPAAAKPAAKPAEAPKAADAPKEGPSRDDVHKALRTYSGPKDAADYEARKDAALAVLHKYSPTLAELKAEDFQEVVQKIADLDKAPKAEVEDDPF